MKLTVVTSIVALFLVVLGFTGTLLFKQALSPINAADNTEIIFEVSRGETFGAVAQRLQNEGLIRSAELLKLYARIDSSKNIVKVGEYALKPSMSLNQILEIVASGKSRTKPFTVPEGYNIFEISELIEKAKIATAKEFLEKARNPKYATELVGYEVPSLEGYLFPETYQIARNTSLDQLLKMMVDLFKVNFSQVQIPQEMSSWTQHQIVTFASIVEKETGAAWERPLISSVFHNRLQKRMRLQTDPTIIYGIADETGKYEIDIGRDDIRRPTRYNTYVISGLPPGPIANPGRMALEAAVNPEQSEYLFFVSKNDGTHIFSKTYEEHNRAVTEWQRNRANREGRSWRDLNQKKSAPAAEGRN